MLRPSAVLLTLLLGLGLPAAAHAQPDAKSQARKFGTEAAQLLDTKRYAEALERVEQAEELFHAPTHLQMKGEALEGLGRLADALATYQRLAAEPLAEDAATAFVRAKEFAQERVRKLSARVPALVIRVAGAPAGAVQATVDGSPFPLGTDSAPRFDAGAHTLVVSAEGFETVERDLTLREQGEPHVVEVTLVPTGSGSPGEDQADDDDEGAGIYWPPWIAFGVGGTGLLVGTITGAMSFGKVGELDDQCPDGRCTPAEQETIDEAGVLGNVSTVGFVIGGVGVAAGIVLLLWRPGADDEDEAPTESADQVRIAPWIGPSALGVKGTF